MEEKVELLRRYGYDILINRFEPLLRNVLLNEVLLINHGLKNWKNEIPLGVAQELEEEKDIDFKSISIEDFFEETYLWCLKEIAIFSTNYQSLINFVGELSKDRFIELMDELNELRHKIAHAKSTFTNLDLSRIIDIIKTICQEGKGLDLVNYINKESFKTADTIPEVFFHDYDFPNNLPIEDYDIDGGFVGRRNEINTVKKLLFSEQDRIVTINGAGGLGKTAVALKTAYNLLSDKNNPYNFIIWFSAKEKRLTEEGIVSIKSNITSCQQLIEDILKIVDNKTLEIFKQDKIEKMKHREHLYGIFSSQKCLLIIDNLETINDEATIEFIKNIPRPSQILITSRKGLGEIERRYNLPDFNENDAILLFRIISKERNKNDLLSLKREVIRDLVIKVRSYPLLIKWSIGKICLGKDINDAFSEIYSGKSEIAEFAFNDIFDMLSEKAKLCLYSMIVFGDKPISKHMLMHLANLDEDDFDNSVRDLILTSFVYPLVEVNDGVASTMYVMLSLVRGFVSSKLDLDEKIMNSLQTRYFELSHQIQELEKSESAYFQSLFSLGIKSEDEKIAFNYIKTAKNFLRNSNFDEAEKNFGNAIRIAPNLNYALTEYAKFEFSRSHMSHSNELFERAIKANPNNFHSFFSYGISLRKQNKLTEAVDMFRKAQELNPQHLPIYNEIGRVLTFKGEYEEAKNQFEKALTQSKHPNLHHTFLALLFLADNYRRWSEDFFTRGDKNGALEKLFEALKNIEETNKLKDADKSSIIIEKEICKDIARGLCSLERFDESIPYFKRCFTQITLKSGKVLHFDEQMVQAYYFYARYGFKLNKLSKEEILKSIELGLSGVKDEKFVARLKELQKEVDSTYSEYKRHSGTINWYNKIKKFGVILTGQDSYIFFLNGFRKILSSKDLNDLEGGAVTFKLIENEKSINKKMATDIMLN